MREEFDQALDHLCKKMAVMFTRVHGAYRDMFDAIKENDHQLAQSIIEQDASINRLEERINTDAMRLILKQCPVASDLRFIITCIKIAGDLERIADYAENISGYLLRSEHDISAQRKSLHEYREPLLSMLLGIAKAFQLRDANAAKKVSQIDDVIDRLYTTQMEALIELVSETKDFEAKEAGRALLAIKQLERAGDHITNIAEHILFLTEAKYVNFNP